MTSDGHRLRESWSNALNDALATFRTHLTSGQSSSWKRVPIPSRENSTASVKAKGRSQLEPKDVSVHRKLTKSGDVYRVMVDIPAGDEVVDLEAWKAALITPELRQEWDPAVESSGLLEMFDPSTRIVKTKFTLGWPANPRDAVMISRTFSDATTVIDISTSLPRSPDEPSYLRPAPPYVRSHVDLFSWCIQLLPPPPPNPISAEPRTRGSFDNGRLRITCFWQHDLKTVWNIGSPNSFPTQVSAMCIGLLETVRRRRAKMTVLTGYGFGVSIERITFDIGRDALTVDYSIHPEDQESSQPGSSLHGLEELQALKEQRRLQRSVELLLPSSEGWDIRISTRASSEVVAQLPWTTTASRLPSTIQTSNKVCFQVRHSALFDDHSVLKVKLVIEYSGVLKGLRLNGLPHVIEDIVERDLKSFGVTDKLLQDASSAANVSMNTNASVTTVESETSAGSSVPPRLPLLRTNSGVSVVPRGPAFDKSILARVRRNYIYFSSLLQEPEAKWKRNTEFRGVSVTQLDSIDPTLVVYKAEATFVGVGLWDLYSAVVTPGARAHWDKLHDDATLLEDVNELSELWHHKTKPAWPVTGRDAVVLKTVYKSPTTVHVFAFSVDDVHMFPSIPVVDPYMIRTQVDLQGWAIEALSPTTTLLTLLEQSDPKGWSGKSTIPQQMIANVAGIGEFAIKCGGPPIVTRFGRAKGTNMRYEHERGVFRVEYQASNTRQDSPVESSEPRTSGRRQNSIDSTQGTVVTQQSENSTSASVELELRCDIDTWASSLDIVVDPPPQSITCLRRHRLSAGGGGLWLTVGHDIDCNSDERLQAIVRRAPSTTTRERGFVMVNGKRVTVDVEELPDSEVKVLTKQKRVKPVRIPLDQPPVLGVIRRRRAEWDADSETRSATESSPQKYSSTPQSSPMTSSPRFPSPLSNFFTTAMEQARSTTQQAVAVFTPPTTSGVDLSFPPSKFPMHYALDALSFAQGYRKGSFRDNWNLVVDKGFAIHRRLSPEISPAFPVHKGEKVIEGVTAEEVASVIFSYDCRKHWDDRFDSVTILEEYGADCHTAFLVTKGGFPFRDRGFYSASMMVRDKRNPVEALGGAQSPTSSPSAIYCISASFNPDSASAFSSAKYNQYTLPVGRAFIDAWVIQTLDPYTDENYAIPSTRCTRLVAFDFAGSIPVTVNSMINTALPRSILAVETYLKGISPFPEMRTPAVGFRMVGDNTEITDPAWMLRRSGEERILLDSKLISDSRIFRSNILVAFSAIAAEIPKSPSEGFEQSTPQLTPKPNKTGLPSRPSSPEAVRRPRIDSVSSTSPTRRHRRISASSVGISPPGSLAMRSRSREVLRSSASNFSIGRDFKGLTPSDFLVAEIVIDLRMYPEGYDVELSSRTDSKIEEPNPVPLTRVSNMSSSESVLPILHSVHILPPSPLYTSGSGVETPVRHLLRLTLPTSQYEIPPVDDPLTGEVRSAPSKPQWYQDLEKDKHALIRVQVKPLASEKRKAGKKIVLVDGVVVTVGSEKDLHKGYAGEETSAGVLSRVQVQEGKDILALPMRLSVPLAVADHLYDQTALDARTQQTSSANETSTTDGDRMGEDSDKGVLSETPDQLTPIDEKPPPLPAEASRGLLGFFTYQNSFPFMRIGPTSSAADSRALTEKAKAPGSYPSATPTPPSETSESKLPIISSADLTTSVTPASTLAAAAITPRYSISTLLAVTLIAFLLGSLLRSLLSPADFIYVVTDLGDIPEGVTRAPGGGLGAVEPGWREIKRLVELKYIVGGWDFQIAVVRRH